MEVDIAEPSPAVRVVSITVDATRLNRWRRSADRVKMSVEEWIVLCIEMSDHLSLIEGVGRLPANGTKMDPVLAAAILQAAKDQPWEHKAMLLVGTSGFQVNPDSPTPTPNKRNWTGRRHHTEQTIRFLAKHGIETRGPKYRKAWLGSNDLTWGGLTLLLYYWHKGGPGWVTAKQAEIAAETGMKFGYITYSANELINRGWLVRKPGLDRSRGSTCRVPPHIGALLDAGNYGLKGR